MKDEVVVADWGLGEEVVDRLGEEESVIVDVMRLSIDSGR